MAVVTVDFDGTLYEGNSFKAMFTAARQEFTVKEWLSVGQGLVKAAAVRPLKGKQAFRHSFFKSFAKSFKGKDAEELDRFFNRLVSEGIGEVNQPLVEEIRIHQKKGDHVVIVSGALHPFLQSFTRELSLDVEIISTELLFDDKGKCTGKLGTIVNGEEKVRKVLDWVTENQTEGNLLQGEEEIWAYADSEHDLPLLNFVHHPVVVNPDTTMKSVALKNSWPIIENKIG